MARKKRFEEDEDEHDDEIKSQRSRTATHKQDSSGGSWTSWIPNLLDFFEVFRSPSKYSRISWQEIFSDLQSASLQNEMFDGFSLDIGKLLGQLSPFAVGQVQHSLKIGSASEAPSYALTSIFQDQTKGWLMGRIDSEGVFAARGGTHGTWYDTKLSVQLAKEAHQNNVTIETDFPFMDAMLGLRWQLPSTVIVNYLQPVSQNVHLGVEGTYLGKQAVTIFNIAGRYTPGLESKKKQKTKKPPNRSIASFQLSQTGIQLAFVKKIDPVFTLTSEYQIGMTQNGLDSTFIGGFDIHAGDQVRSRVQVDSSLTVKGIIEETYSDITRLTLCSEMDHKKQAYKIGVGIQLSI